MATFVIRAPIWNTLSVGLDERKVTDDNIVRITYRKRDGSLLYPNDFKVTKKYLMAFGIPKTVKGVPLIIIRISEMEEIDD